MTKVTKRIIDKFGDIATIWQFKDDENQFVVFKKYFDVEGIYYNSKTDEIDKDFIDCVALERACTLIHSKKDKSSMIVK